MVDRIIAYFKQFDFPISSHTLALFRILYSIYNIGIVWQLHSNWELYFDHITPFTFSLFPVKLSLFLWLTVNIGLLFGIMTKYAALSNYVLTIIMTTFFANTNISSFNDDLLRIGGFLLVLLPCAKTYSIDAFLLKFSYPKRVITTSYLYYLLAILLSLGLLYFASAISKLFSPMWQHGIGLWTPAVIPNYKWNSFTFFVDYKWLMFSLNYFVITFELAFIFLLFYKKTHAYLAIIGIGFHLGIALLFPFTYVSLGPVIYYSLFIPAHWWVLLKQKLQVNQVLTIQFNPNSVKHFYAIQFLKTFNFRQRFIFDASPQTKALKSSSEQNWDLVILCLKKSVLGYPLSWMFKLLSIRNLVHFITDSWLSIPSIQQLKNERQLAFNRFAFFLFVAVIVGVQLLTLGYHSYTALKADKQKKQTYLKQRIANQDFSTKPSNLARTFFGINSRGVFLDHAFTGSKTVFTIAYLNTKNEEQWLPIFTKEGYAMGENKNLGWHKLSFKYFGINQYNPNPLGLQKYTWLWASKNHLSPQNLTFRVYRRIYPFPTQYEKGYLHKMILLPWDTVGIITWKDSVFSYQSLLVDSVLQK